MPPCSTPDCSSTRTAQDCNWAGIACQAWQIVALAMPCTTLSDGSNTGCALMGSPLDTLTQVTLPFYSCVYTSFQRSLQHLYLDLTGRSAYIKDHLQHTVPITLGQTMLFLLHPCQHTLCLFQISVHHAVHAVHLPSPLNTATRCRCAACNSLILAATTCKAHCHLPLQALCRLWSPCTLAATPSAAPCHQPGEQCPA